MPKIPDDMSAAAEKKREALTAASKAKPAPAQPAPPKPRIAKKR
jgi:hypothetical protein